MIIAIKGDYKNSHIIARYFNDEIKSHWNYNNSDLYYYKSNNDEIEAVPIHGLNPDFKILTYKDLYEL